MHNWTSGFVVACSHVTPPADEPLCTMLLHLENTAVETAFHKAEQHPQKRSTLPFDDVVKTTFTFDQESDPFFKDKVSSCSTSLCTFVWRDVEEAVLTWIFHFPTFLAKRISAQLTLGKADYSRTLPLLSRTVSLEKAVRCCRDITKYG